MNTGMIGYLSFLITFQLLFVGIFLMSHKKGNPRNNRILGSLFLLMAWNLGDITLKMNEQVLPWPILQTLDDGFFLLYGPLLLIYTRCVIYNDYKLRPIHLLHSLPYLLFLVVLSFVSEKIPSTSSQIVERQLPWQLYLGSAVIYLHFFSYLALAFSALKKYRKVIREKYSQVEQLDLDWLTLMLNTFLAMACLSLVQNFITLSENKTLFLLTLILLLLFVFYFVIKVILKALRQPEIFAGISKQESEKYSGSGLTNPQLELHKEQLALLFAQEKPYLDPQLNLGQLAEKLNLTPKLLSQVINQGFEKSFFDFVNAHRIAEAQQILATSQDPKLTVLEVMFEVGFNSKSSFNTAFKKETGLTPSEFRKRT